MSEQLNIVIGVLLHALVEAAPYLVAGFVLAAVLREFVPTATINAWFGGRGVMPLLRATGVGTLLPICSCGVIPLGIGAYRAGAARGTALAFMAATPLISPLSVLLAWSLLGPQLTIALMAAALIGALAIGLIDNYLRGGHAADGTTLPDESPSACCDTNDACEASEHQVGGSWLSRSTRAMRWALLDFGPQVSVDMFLGLCVAAVMLAIVPPDVITNWVGSGDLISLLAVVLVALPVYTCTLPTIPIVKGFLLLGMGSGAGVALLVAGPATNLGEINAMRRQMGGATALFFVVALIVVGVTAGATVDAIAGQTTEATNADGNRFDIAAITENSEHADLAHLASELTLWQWPCIVLLIGVLSVGIYQRLTKLPAKLKNRPSIVRWLFGKV